MGGEIQKRRPAVIVSNDLSNRSLNRVQVVPLTSSTGRVYVSDALVTVGGQQSKAMADQLTTVSVLRVGTLLGVLSDTDMAAIEQAIRVQLAL